MVFGSTSSCCHCSWLGRYPIPPYWWQTLKSLNTGAQDRGRLLECYEKPHLKPEEDMLPEECRMGSNRTCTHSVLPWNITKLDRYMVLPWWMDLPRVVPPRTGTWPRNERPENLLSPYGMRSPPLLAWAYACFEQGSLPSLMIPGDASMMVLPGNRMFQTQRIVPGKCRPVILHGFGGAKKIMAPQLILPLRRSLLHTDHEE